MMRESLGKFRQALHEMSPTDGVAGFRFFYPQNQNATRQLDDPGAMLDQWLEMVLDDLMDRLDMSPDEALEVVETTLDTMAEEGIIPPFPEEDASDEEVAMYMSSVTANASVMARFAEVAEEEFGAVEFVPGE